MEKEQMEQGFTLQRNIDRLKKNLDSAKEVDDRLNNVQPKPRPSIIAPDLAHPEYNTSKMSRPESIGMEFMICALPNNFFAAYKCNLEIEIQRLEQEFKNL